MTCKNNGNHSGGVAQLGERLNGIQEVRGSIPLASIVGWLRAMAASDVDPVCYSRVRTSWLESDVCHP